MKPDYTYNDIAQKASITRNIITYVGYDVGSGDYRAHIFYPDGTSDVKNNVPEKSMGINFDIFSIRSSSIAKVEKIFQVKDGKFKAVLILLEGEKFLTTVGRDYGISTNLGHWENTAIPGLEILKINGKIVGIDSRFFSEKEIKKLNSNNNELEEFMRIPRGDYFEWKKIENGIKETLGWEK